MEYVSSSIPTEMARWERCDFLFRLRQTFLRRLSLRLFLILLTRRLARRLRLLNFFRLFLFLGMFHQITK